MLFRSADAEVMSRVAADSVPPWIRTVIGRLIEAPSKAHTLEKAMGLEEKTRRSGYGAHRELVRLRRAGLIQWNMQLMHWSIVEEHRERLQQVIAGRGFE